MRNRGNPELLGLYLDVLERVIRRELSTPELANPQTPRNAFQRGELLEALESVADARAELAKCPEGAPLAFALMEAQLARLRMYAHAGEVAVSSARRAAREKAERARNKSRAHEWLVEMKSRRPGVTKEAAYGRIERREGLQPGSVKKAILRLSGKRNTR